MADENSPVIEVDFIFCKLSNFEVQKYGIFFDKQILFAVIYSNLSILF